MAENGYLPLRFVQTVEKKVPHGLEMLAAIHDSNGADGLPEWPEWCYAPITSALAVVYEGADYALLGDEEDIPIAEVLAAVGAWLPQKKVFVLSPELEAVLTANKRLLSRFPSKDLTRIPATGFYVQTSNLSVCGLGIHGMFVSLDFDPGTREQLFQVVFLYEFCDYTAFLISANEKSVFGAILESLDGIVARYDVVQENGEFSGPFTQHNYDTLKTLMEKAMNIIVFLYLMHHYNEQHCFAQAAAANGLSFDPTLDLVHLALPESGVPRSLRPFCES